MKGLEVGAEYIDHNFFGDLREFKIGWKITQKGYKAWWLCTDDGPWGVLMCVPLCWGWCVQWCEKWSVRCDEKVGSVGWVWWMEDVWVNERELTCVGKKLVCADENTVLLGCCNWENEWLVKMHENGGFR